MFLFRSIIVFVLTYSIFACSFSLFEGHDAAPRASGAAQRLLVRMCLHPVCPRDGQEGRYAQEEGRRQGQGGREEVNEVP